MKQCAGGVVAFVLETGVETKPSVAGMAEG